MVTKYVLNYFRILKYFLNQFFSTIKNLYEQHVCEYFRRLVIIVSIFLKVWLTIRCTSLLNINLATTLNGYPIWFNRYPCKQCTLCIPILTMRHNIKNKWVYNHNILIVFLNSFRYTTTYRFVTGRVISCKSNFLNYWFREFSNIFEVIDMSCWNKQVQLCSA